MNRIRPEATTLLNQAFREGRSVGFAARSAGVHRISARRYRREHFTELRRCACGREAGHNGWCVNRFAESPQRQAVLAAMHHGIRPGVVMDIRCGDGRLCKNMLVTEVAGNKVTLAKSPRGRGRWWLPLAFVIQNGRITRPNFPTEEMRGGGE